MAVSTAISLEEFEAELKTMLLFDGDSYQVANRWYNDFKERSGCDTSIVDQVHYTRAHVHVDDIVFITQQYVFSEVVLRIGERFSLVGNTPVEKAAARQWVQYRITRLGTDIDKRELEEVLQVSIGLYHYHCYHGNIGIR